MVTNRTFSDLRMMQTSHKIKGRKKECGKLDETGSTEGTLASRRPRYSRTHENLKVVFSLKKAIDQWP